MHSSNGLSVDRPQFDSLCVSVEIPEELRDSLVSCGNMVSVQDSLLDDLSLDEGSIVIQPISSGKMEEIARCSEGDLQMLPYRIIEESLISPRLSAAQIRGLSTRMIDFIFTEIYKINGFRCQP